MQLDSEATTDAAVDLLWDLYRENGGWPSTKAFLLRAVNSGLSVAALRRCSALSLRAGSGEEVRPTFDALISLDEVRDLLAPLPLVLRQAASVFASQAPLLPDHTLPQLNYGDVKGHWKDPSRAKTAFDVLRTTSSGFFVGSQSSGGDPDDVSFSISIDYMRYEHVDDLEEVLWIHQGRRATDPGRFPSGQHLELLRRIYDASKREQRWPRALPFAIATRDVGYVPQLSRELHSRFIRGEFNPTRHHSLELTLDALPFVDPSGQDRALLVKAVRKIVDVWRSRTGKVEISLDELAVTLGVNAETLGPVVAFLEPSRWCTVGHAREDTHRDLVLTPGDPVLVLRNTEVNTFDEYMNTWDEAQNDTFGAIVFGSLTPTAERKDQMDAPVLPDLPFDFVKSDSYRHVVDRDLEELGRAIGASAWKASLILIGGIIEGALLDVLSRREDLAESHLRKDLSRASLMDLIEASVKLGFVPEPVLPFAEGAKDYRDLVHPYRSGASKLRPAVGSVRAMLNSLELIVTELDAAWRDGRLSRFERM